MLKNVYISNFKKINELTVNCDGQFFVLIGENNIGKTSVFEAIHLWKMCYDINVTKKGDGFYSESKNLPFRDLEFIRVSHDRDLFPANKRSDRVTITIKLTIKFNDTDYCLGFKLNKATTVDDAYLQVKYYDKQQFVNFASAVKASAKTSLTNVISINESRPVANIIAREPVMNKAEVIDKLAKGKGYDVLRNKIILNMENVEKSINEVTGENHKFSRIDSSKSYIDLKVDKKDILSCGSGFIQLAELFSSIEFSDSKIKILLIDEPDAHLHVKLQRALVKKLASLSNFQLFIISHNERFVSETDEDHIIFLSDLEQPKNVSCIPLGSKNLVIEGLKGALDNIDVIRNATRIIFVEGKTDKTFIEQLLAKYSQYSGTAIPDTHIVVLDGIDTCLQKLHIYVRAYCPMAQQNCKWFFLRDTDCVPISKKTDEATFNTNKCQVPVSVIFQEGYGIESTYVSEPGRLASLLASYYSISDVARVETVIRSVNDSFATRVKMECDAVHDEYKEHFDRQKESRGCGVYRDLKIGDTLSEITKDNVQYIMTKKILEMYYGEIHNQLVLLFPSISSNAITYSDVQNQYLSTISNDSDLFQCHKDILNDILQ